MIEGRQVFAKITVIQDVIAQYYTVYTVLIIWPGVHSRLELK